MKRTVAIVQARIGSQRLPGKSLLTLGRWPILEWVLRRLKNARSLDHIVLATSRADENEALCDLAERLEIESFRGSEEDVLQRICEAAKIAKADHVVRVCADCPLVDFGEVDRLVTDFHAVRPDYSFNHIPALGNGYPDGLGAEVLTADCLERLADLATEPSHREHVTAYIWDHPDRFNISTMEAPSEITGSEIKLDIDTGDDLARLEELASRWKGLPEEWSAPEIVTLYRQVFGQAMPEVGGVVEDEEPSPSSQKRPHQ